MNSFSQKIWIRKKKSCLPALQNLEPSFTNFLFSYWPRHEVAFLMHESKCNLKRKIKTYRELIYDHSEENRPSIKNLIYNPLFSFTFLSKPIKAIYSLQISLFLSLTSLTFYNWRRDSGLEIKFFPNGLGGGDTWILIYKFKCLAPPLQSNETL